MPPLVYVSCAPVQQDRDGCADLVKQLRPFVKAGQIVLWHDGLLSAGQDVAATRRAQRQRAAVHCALLSPDWLDDDALGAEAAETRAADGLLVPIVFRPCTFQLPGSPFAGLQPLLHQGHPICQAGDRDAAWVEVAEQLDAAARRPVSSRAPLSSVFAAALRLNRGHQWGELQRHLALTTSTLFLLCGHHRQRVALFAHRVIDHLERERPDRHLLLTLSHRDGPHAPHTVAEWTLRLTESLQHKISSREGDPATLLRRAAAERPLFLLLGRRPFEQPFLGDAEAALRDFLAVRLPELLRRAAPDNPVRCLVLAQYKGQQSRGLVDRLVLALRDAQAAGLDTCALTEPRTPQWKDVEDLLPTLRPPPTEEDVRRAKRAFEDLMADDRDPDLKDIARALRPMLHDDDGDEEEDE